MTNKDPHLQRYEAAWKKAQDEQAGRSARWSGITCPEQFDQTCKLCELARAIFRNRENESEAMIERAYDLCQKTKAYINVVLRNDPKKVIVLEIGKSILSDLMDLQNGVKGEEYVNFFSFTNGRMIKIIKKGKGRKTEYEVWPRDSASKFPDSYMKQVYDLENIEKLIDDKTVEPMRASQLEEGVTELRILPNWRFGEKIELFFYSIKHHVGLTASEFALVQSGQYNPFKSASIPDEAEVSGGFADEEEQDIPDSVTDSMPDKTKADADPFGGEVEEDEKGIEFADAGDMTESGSHSPCHGNAADYNPDDAECKECPEFKECGDKVGGK